MRLLDAVMIIGLCATSVRCNNGGLSALRIWWVALLESSSLAMRNWSCNILV